MLTYVGSLIAVFVHVLSFSEGFILLVSSTSTSSYNQSFKYYIFIAVYWMDQIWKTIPIIELHFQLKNYAALILILKQIVI